MRIQIIAAACFIVFLGMLFSFQTNNAGEKDQVKKGMIKVTILYANGQDKKFDIDYYTQKHMPMVARLLGDSLKYYEIDKGIAGRNPADSVPYLAIGYLYFERLSAYRSSFGPHAKEIVSDIPNYTNIQPVIQISEVIK